MTRILCVLVGGTICSAPDDRRGTIDICPTAGVRLKDRFLRSGSPHADAVDIRLTDNLNILSENMTVAAWNRIADTLREHQKTQHYDGIVIAHGTDTLAYSAALFSLLFNTTPVPIFLVSGNACPDSPRSNAHANFAYAVECICRGIRPNVYVTYRNLSDGVMYLHLGSRLRQCSPYSEDFFSEGAVPIAGLSDAAFADCFAALDRLYPRRAFPPAVPERDGCRLSDRVLNLVPYVGIRYDVYRYEAFRAVLHGAYHSGTACAGAGGEQGADDRNSLLYLLDRCAEHRVDVYISPARSDGEVYDTVRILREHGSGGQKIRFLYGMTDEMAYVKILLAYSRFSDRQDIDAFLSTAYNYEFIRP